MKKYDFENSIGFIVNVTAKSLQRALDLELRKTVGVTIGQWKVIAALSIQDGLTQKEIAERVGVEGATLVPIIDRMEQEGFVERRADTNDRRNNRIYLTKKSESLWRSMIECALHVRKKALKDVADEDLDVARSVLRKVTENLATYLETEEPKSPEAITSRKKIR